MSPAQRATPRRSLAWTAAVAVPLVVAAAILVPMTAGAAVDLPDKTVEELLAFAQESDVDALSGTIEQTSELGIPDLSGLAGAWGAAPGSSSGEAAPTAADMNDLIELATGSHTANVYLDGDRARLQVLDTLAERNVYAAPGELWYLDSETQTATRFSGPAGAHEQSAEPKSGGQSDVALHTPDEMLDQALARLDETTVVTVGTDARVAGRDVYELILTPRADDTLIGSIRFAIDGENGTALAASITAKAATEPAFEVAFTKVSFDAPDPATLVFTPGEFAVIDQDLPNTGAHSDGEGADAATPTVFGEAWSTVIELPSAAGADVFGSQDSAGMLDGVTTAVAGGRVLETSLLTVLITDDGRVLMGAVAAPRLIEVADTGR